MKNSMVTFPRTVVPKELKMFRKSVSGLGLQAAVVTVYSFQCILSLVSLETACSGNFHQLSSVS